MQGRHPSGTSASQKAANRGYWRDKFGYRLQGGIQYPPIHLETAMDYIVKFSYVMYGDAPPLFKVADAIARRRTTGGVPNRFIQKIYEQEQARIYNHLMDEARKGTVNVCDQFGRHAPIADIVKSDPIAILRPEHPEIFTLHVKQKHLADWGALNGDTFIFQDTGYEDILFSNGSRGTIAPAEPEALTNQADAVEPAGNGPSLSRKKRRTWRDVAWLYMTEVFNAGRYPSAKQFYKALENKAGAESPFDRGTGQNSDSLFVREVSESLNLKTVQNNWQEIKATRKKI